MEGRSGSIPQNSSSHCMRLIFQIDGSRRYLLLVMRGRRTWIVSGFTVIEANLMLLRAELDYFSVLILWAMKDSHPLT